MSSTVPNSPTPLPSLEGRTYLVTGGNTGIGYRICLHLAAHSARVYMGARSVTKAASAISEIRKLHPNADIHPLILDHTSLASVRSAAETLRQQEQRIHGIINNAGIMGTPFSQTSDGHEIQWQTNYLAHWLLTYLLLPTLLETAKSCPPGTVRIVNVSSDGHARFPPKGGVDFEHPNLESEGALTRYGQSKLANILHAKSLHAQYGPNSTYATTPGNGEIWTAAVDPGHVDTQLNVKASSYLGMSWLLPVLKFAMLVKPDKGAKSSLFAVAGETFKRDMSGLYIGANAKVETPSSLAKDEMLREKLEKWTKELMKLED